MSPTNGENDQSCLNESDLYPVVEYGTESGSDKNKGNGRLEWKRYKQYTRDDILTAIEEVKNGVSALQASRKYGIPSRTLYDKVKKMGIPTANMQRIEKQKQAASATQLPQSPLPINFLGLQLPQAQLPRLPLHPSQLPQGSLGASENQATTTIHYPANTTAPNLPLMGSAAMLKTKALLEKIDSLAREQAQQRDQTPLNLSTLLDSNIRATTEPTGSVSGEHSDGNQRKSVSPEGVCISDAFLIKDEKPREDDIRAQFLADLKRSFGNKEGSSQIPVIKTLPNHQDVDEESGRDDRPKNMVSPQDNLPAKKRKFSHEVTEENDDSNLENIQEYQT